MIGKEWKESLEHAFDKTAAGRLATESNRISDLIGHGSVDEAMDAVRALAFEMYGLGFHLKRLEPRQGKTVYMSETVQNGIDGICGMFFDQKDEKYEQLRNILLAFVEDAIREALGITSLLHEQANKHP